jgi:peroxiredoxin
MGQKASGMVSGEAANQRTIKVGEEVPAIEIDHGFNPIGKVNMSERLKGKKVAILGLPGAFTPC